jgi:hypothetical protein
VEDVGVLLGIGDEGFGTGGDGMVFALEFEADDSRI